MINTQVSFDSIKNAQAVLQTVAQRTPLFTSSTFDSMADCQVYLKAENLQKTGSFKIRGAYYCLQQIAQHNPKAHVVTASAGNHAQGIALGARLNGIKTTVFMPTRASLAKVQATTFYGADVQLVGEIYDEAVAAALDFASSTNSIFVSAFDHDAIIAGQGTVGLEIYEDLPDVDTVVVPVGGGGLMSGVAIALKTLRPSIKLIGVQAEGAAALVRSVHEKKLIWESQVHTIADGIAVKHPAERTFYYIQKYVDEMVAVSDEMIAHAMMLLLERTKLLVEGAGAVALAAMLSQKIKKTGKTAVILSGGNIDTKFLSALIERSMLRVGRYVRLFTAVEDKPGGLAKILQVIADMRGNLIEVIHNRVSGQVPLGATGVEIQLETRNKEHITEIVQRLRALNYLVDIMP